MKNQHCLEIKGYGKKKEILFKLVESKLFSLISSPEKGSSGRSVTPQSES